MLAAFLALPSFSQNTIGFASPTFSSTGSLITSIVSSTPFTGTVKVRFEMSNTLSPFGIGMPPCYNPVEGYFQGFVGSSYFNYPVDTCYYTYYESVTYSVPVTSISVNMYYKPPTFPVWGTFYVIAYIIEVPSTHTIGSNNFATMYIDYN